MHPFYDLLNLKPTDYEKDIIHIILAFVGS
jgi:hypothetical protein